MTIENKNKKIRTWEKYMAKPLTPEFVLNSGQPQRHEAIVKMLEAEGFEVARDNGSHCPVRHTDPRYSDLTGGLTKNHTSYEDLGSQKSAARLCLEVQRRRYEAQQSFEDFPVEDVQVVNSDHDDEIKEFPNDLLVAPQNGQVFIRHKEFPEVGTLVHHDSGDDVYAVVYHAASALREEVGRVKEALNIAENDFSFTFERTEEGVLVASHPVFMDMGVVIPHFSPENEMNCEKSLGLLTDTACGYNDYLKDIAGNLFTLPIFNSHETETHADGSQTVSAKMRNVLTEHNTPLSYTLDRNGIIDGADVIGLYDRIFTTLFSDDLKTTLQRKFGLTIKGGRNGFLTLQQPLLGTEKSIADPFSRPSCSKRAQDRLQENDDLHTMPLEAAYKQATDAASEFWHIWNDVVSCAEAVVEYCKENDIPHRAGHLDVGLSRAGFKANKEANDKLGRENFITYNHENGYSLRVPYQLLQSTTPNKPALLIPVEYLDKMQETLEKVREQTHLQTHSGQQGAGFSLTAMYQSAGGAGGGQSRDPIRDAIMQTLGLTYD
jgi:hypothetical protein